MAAIERKSKHEAEQHVKDKWRPDKIDDRYKTRENYLRNPLFAGG